MKKVIVSVTNDLSTDQRVHRTCTALQKLGFEVLLVGRNQKSSQKLVPRTYVTKRMNLIFEKNFLFYAEYHIRLYLFLLFRKADVFVSNDLDTLLPNYLISKIKQVALVYDTHEIFCEVPELQNSPTKKNIWKSIERIILPQLKHIFTVNNSIAKLYQEEYKVKIQVVRNISQNTVQPEIKSKRDLGLPTDKKIIVLQGAGINVDRGAEEAVQAMQFVHNAVLLIIGGGDVYGELKKLASNLDLNDKIIFMPKMPYLQMMQYTAVSDIGLTLDKNSSLNYRYSLPNKIFDYINAGIPVLASPLVEIKNIFDTYCIGELIENHSPQHIADKLNEMLHDTTKQQLWKKNLGLAAIDYTWENEEKKLINVYQQFLG